MARHPGTGDRLSGSSLTRNRPNGHPPGRGSCQDDGTGSPVGYLQGHPYVCAIVRFRDQVMPDGIRLYVKRAHCPALDLPFRKTPELAAQRIRVFEAPAGVKVVVLFETDDLCRGVVQACRERHCRFASTRKSNRRRCNASWKLNAGRYGRNLFRRRRTATLVLANPHGQARDRFIDAGGLEVSPSARCTSSSRAQGPQRLFSDS